jgi:hypothetical protein
LAIKDKLNKISFANLCEGLRSNSSIKELTLRVVENYDFSELSLALNQNTSVKSLLLQCQSGPVEDIEDTDSMASTLISLKSYSPVLSENNTITSYTLSGYIYDSLVTGIGKNQTLSKLALENIGLDRRSASIWKDAFRQNSSIKDLEIKRGFNSNAAIIIFNSLRYNKSIKFLKLQECTFHEAGYMTLKELLRYNKTIAKIEIKDMLHMGVNTNERDIAIRNFVHVVQGLEENKSIVEASLCVYRNSNSSNSLFTGFDLQSPLSSFLINNQTLTFLKIEGFGLTGKDVCSICASLKENQSLETLILTKNLIEWNDLSCIIDDLSHTKSLKKLELAENKLFDYQNLEKLKNPAQVNECLSYMKNIFEKIVYIRLTELSINEWFWDIRYYPIKLHSVIKFARNSLPNLRII